MNGPTNAQVDAAVREVLDGLNLGLGRRGAGSIVEVFAGRLLSLRQVEGLGAGTAELRVAPGTVVTPLARDELKRRGIAIRWVSEREAGAAGREGEWGFAIETESGMAAALRRALLAGPTSWREVGADATAAAQWVAASDARGAVVLTDDAAPACWRANRAEGVRAAAIAEAGAVARAIRTLGVNLLVIEPTGQTIFALKHLCATFRRGGAPAPPPELGEGPTVRADGHEDRRGDRPGHPVAGPSRLAERPVPGRAAAAPRGPDRGLAGAW